MAEPAPVCTALSDPSWAGVAGPPEGGEAAYFLKGHSFDMLVGLCGRISKESQAQKDKDEISCEQEATPMVHVLTR